jgi:hypothetical protein
VRAIWIFLFKKLNYDLHQRTFISKEVIKGTEKKHISSLRMLLRRKGWFLMSFLATCAIGNSSFARAAGVTQQRWLSRQLLLDI